MDGRRLCWWSPSKGIRQFCLNQSFVLSYKMKSMFLEYITSSQGITIWIRSDQQTSKNTANNTKSLQNCFYPKHLKLPQGLLDVPQWTPPQKYLQHHNINTWEQLLKFSPSSFLRKGSCLVSALPGRFGTLIWTVRVTWRSGESVGASSDFESCLMFSPHLSTIWTQSSAFAQRLLATVEKKNEDLSLS